MTGIVETPSSVAPPLAQQIFTIGSAVAGGLAGFWLAKHFVGIKEVPVAPLVAATAISAIFTVGAALMLTRSLEREY